VYIPVTTSVYEHIPAFAESGTAWDDDSVCRVMGDLMRLADSDMVRYNDKLKEVMSELRQYMIDVFPEEFAEYLRIYKESPEDAADYITGFTMLSEQMVLEKATEVYEDLLTMMIVNNGSYIPYFDAVILSERYGWVCTSADNVFTFVNGEDRMSVRIVDDSMNSRGTMQAEVDLNGEIRSGVYCYLKDGDLYLSFDEYAETFISSGAVVLYEYEKDESGFYGLIFAISGMIAVALIVTFIIRSYR